MDLVESLSKGVTLFTYKELPIVGPIYYQWFGGGAEKYNERQQQRLIEK